MRRMDREEFIYGFDGSLHGCIDFRIMDMVLERSSQNGNLNRDRRCCFCCDISGNVLCEAA